MSVHLALWEAARDLTAKARLTLATGAAVEPESAEVLSFSVDEGADSPLLPGAVLSAKYTLVLANDAGQWRWGGSLRGERPLVGATAQLFVTAGESDIPCGAFIVDSVRADEGSGVIRLSGSDSIAHELAAAFEDGLTYPATLSQLWAHWLSKTPYAWPGELPGGDLVIPAAPQWKNATLRKAAGWMAQAAGCMLRLGRTGALEIVACTGGEATAITPDHYMTLGDGFDTFGPVHALTVTPADDGEAAVTVADGLGAEISIEGNPLFTAGEHLSGMAEAVLERLSGLELAKAEFRWRGDPAVGVGSRVALTDTAGSTLLCTVTRQTLKFDRGFSAACVCAVPESGLGGVVRAVTPEGGLNAGALVGAVDGGLLRAESVTAKAIAANTISAGHLAAGAVTAEKIAAGAVTAQKLAAESVTAEKLHADSVSGEVAKFMTAQINAITADRVSTDALYAAFAHLIGLAAGSISAGNVDADQLAARLAQVVSLHAATGEFDFATVQNLVGGALSLEKASADNVFIRNLAVTSANLLSATLGELVVKGSDGGYYRIVVGSDGAIGTEAVSVSDGEIAAGQTAAGCQIVETAMNVAELNAQNIQGASAVINTILTTALSAGKITAGEALIASAAVPALYTTSIQAIGNALDLSANESIHMIVGEQPTIHRSEIPPTTANLNDLWIQPATGYTFQRIDDDPSLPEFWLDDSGVLYYSYDDGATAYAMYMDETGVLYVDESAPFALVIGDGGEAFMWMRVKDSEWGAAIDGAVTGLERQIGATYSEFSQRADSIELAMTKLVNAEALRTYMRYEDGTLELGRSDSRYTTRTSDSGFMVLQDGAVMASMEQNTISGPVVNARRMFTIGEHNIRLGATGHLIFN